MKQKINWEAYEEPILDAVEAYLAKPEETTWTRLKDLIKRCVATWITHEADYKKCYDAISALVESIKNDTPYIVWDIIVATRATYKAGQESKRRR